MDNHLDHYCERIDIGIWGEPFNAFSNIGFIIVFFLLLPKYIEYRHYTKKSANDYKALLLLLCLIGLGSTYWHVQSTLQSLWADRVPILLFINLYILSCLYRVLNCTIVSGIAFFILYHIVGAAIILTWPPETLNRSIFYLSTWLMLATITTIVSFNVARSRKYFFLALSFFSIAIIFRSIDLTACATIPIGTHFIWHLLVSITLYYLMLALLIERKTIK